MKFLSIGLFFIFVVVLSENSTQSSAPFPFIDPDLNIKLKSGDSGPFTILGHIASEDKETLQSIRRKLFIDALTIGPEPRPIVGRCYGWEPTNDTPLKRTKESVQICRDGCFFIEKINFNELKQILEKYGSSIDRVYELLSGDETRQSQCLYEYGQGSENTQAQFLANLQSQDETNKEK